MHPRTVLRFLPPLAGLLPLLALNPISEAASVSSYYLKVPYGTTTPDDPLYAETQFDLFYPEGACPNLPGCSAAPRPLFIQIHGGNTNNPLSGPEQLSPLALQMLAQGFVVVIPSFHVIDTSVGQDFVSATQDLARLIQFVRYHRWMLNIDPERIFLLGHSGGGFHVYYLGLKEDFQNLDSADPIERESSRPNFLVPWACATDWSCFDYANPATNPFIPFLVFGVPKINQVPPQEIEEASPVYWLKHPELYGRTSTPPMCLIYNLSFQTPCGLITNEHDGSFGTFMWKAVKNYCRNIQNADAVCASSVLVDSTANVDQTVQQAVHWMASQAYP